MTILRLERGLGRLRPFQRCQQSQLVVALPRPRIMSPGLGSHASCERFQLQDRIAAFGSTFSRPFSVWSRRTGDAMGHGPKLPEPRKSTLHEDIYTIPNILTLSRIVAAPFIGYLILQEQHTLALGLFTYAGASDLLDGYIARRWNTQTVVGTVIDPMADKALMTILTVCLAVNGALPVWVAVIILLRDVGLGVAAIYYRWISLPPPKTFTRYWDFSLPSAEVRPTTISKYNTALQLALLGLTTAAPVVPYNSTVVLSILQYVVATTTIWSGASYVFSKDAVKILNQAGKSDNPE